MLKTSFGVFISLLAVAIGTEPAQACKGKTVLFKEDFTKPRPAWQKPSPDWGVTWNIGGGKMVAKSPPNEWGVISYNGKIFPEADVCVDVVFPAIDSPENKWAGIWFTSEDGWYTAALQFNGTVAVHSQQQGQWIDPLPETQVNGVKTGAGAVNTLRVTWKAPPRQGSSEPADSNVTFYVNDQEVGSIDVDPFRGRLIGFGIQTEGQTVEFRNLVVTK
jgi:hypothetical protein